MAEPAGPAVDALRIENAAVAYDAGPVLTGVTGRVGAGEVVALIGPNGAGKSTLIKAVLGLVPVVGGTVTVLGRPPAAARRDVAYVPQADTLDAQFPVSVAQVVLMGRYRRVGWLRRPGRADRRIAAEALEQVGLGDRARATFGALSGGQRQRVLLARAIAQRPRLLLLDEPFNGVDLVSQDALLRVLAERKQEGTAVLISTHDLTLARHVADHACLLNRQMFGFGPTGSTLTPDRLRATYGHQALAFHRALLEAVLVGTVCGLIGVQVVLRRQAFFTMAMTHATFPGVVIAAVTGFSLYLGGAAAGVLAALAVTALARRRGHDASTATAVALAAGFALGVALVSAQNGFTKDLTAYLTGSILTVDGRDLAVAGAVTAAVGLVLAALHKELLFTAFDPAGARAAGYRTGAIDLLVLVLIEAVVATAAPAVGTILTLALVVAPAGAARLWTGRIAPMSAFAVLVAVGSAIGGLLLSRTLDVAAGGAISLLAAAGFAVSAIAAPRRGLIAHLRRRSARASVHCPTGTRCRKPKRVTSASDPGRRGAPMPYADRHERISALFRALAAPLRLAIVELLIAHHQLHVHEIVEATGAPQTLTSQHLRVLRAAQLVDRIQDGRSVIYRLVDPEIAALLATAARCFGDLP
ncbi:metalloregulator ArsR/SmtB family transcription factor [Dactylosporangium sp. CA-139066]|uniref:metalloregulator ArsR/SmtB family transcription factor n=1 Tax=Dactylosporangium sp. CA-139066 TaxID=3239930 RepID=UPI003D94946B